MRSIQIPVPLRCVAAGLALAGSLPPWGWWPLAFVGIALVDRLLEDQPRRARFQRAAGVTLSWMLPATLWMWGLTPPGYIVASLIFSTYVALAAAAVPAGTGRRPALVGAMTLMEFVRWHWPFGGVPIAHLAMTQAAGPLLPIARIAGAIGLVACVIAVGVGLSAMTRREIGSGAASLGAVAILLGVAHLAPDGEAIEQIDVAVVQGGGPQRTIYSRSQGLPVLERHLEASEKVPSGLDLVLWPENVVNAEPVPDEGVARSDDWLYADDAERRLSDLARRLDAPLIPGWVEDAGPGRFYNYSVVYGPDGERGDRYDKVRLVPFGEFVPFRSLIELVAPASLPSKDAVPGTEHAVLDTPDGRLGIVISWEVFFSRRARDAIGNGGEILLNPTNGSSYWLTQVQTQQVASSVLRAVETGRWVLQAAPTGFSAVIGPDGTVHQRTGISEQAVLLDDVERRTGETWWIRTGPWPTLVVAVGLSVGGHLASRRSESRRRAHDPTGTSSKNEAP